MKTCCDNECAQANDCQVGGIPCAVCEKYFCSVELSRIGDILVCDDCNTVLKFEGLVW